MILDNVCKLFDVYEVTDVKNNIGGREYLSLLESVYSDGSVEKSVGSDGYIHIKSVKDAEYILFVDVNHMFYLNIYKYTHEMKYKEIINNLNALKETYEALPGDNKPAINRDVCLATDKDVNMAGLVDINAFKCQVCDSADMMDFKRVNGNPDALMCKCKVCHSEYTFVPSRYYRMSSKKIVYSKSNNLSRDVQIK